MIVSIRYCSALYPFGDIRRGGLRARGLRVNRGAFIALEERIVHESETSIAVNSSEFSEYRSSEI